MGEHKLVKDLTWSSLWTIFRDKARLYRKPQTFLFWFISLFCGGN